MSESGPKYIPHHFSLFHRVKGFASGYFGAGLGLFMYDRMFNQDLGAFQTPATNAAAIAVGVLATFLAPPAGRKIYAHIQISKLESIDTRLEEMRAQIVRNFPNDPLYWQLSKDAEDLTIKLQNEGILPHADNKTILKSMNQNEENE
jgi:hypothetical protein